MQHWEFPPILAQAQPFRGLSDGALDAVWRAGQSFRAEQGQEVFTQGDTAERCYVLLEGRIKLTKVDSDGDSFVVGFITPGEIFACVAVYGGESYPASATAVEASRVVGWTHEAFQQLVDAYPEIGQNAMETFGQRLQVSRERAAEMATKTSEQRIAAALLRLARRRSDRPAEDAALRAPIHVSRQDIASMSGTALYTVSRTLQAWSRAGLVDVGRQRVAVSDPQGLERIVEG
jgi:CRP-like cAMP-binding protein